MAGYSVKFSFYLFIKEPNKTSNMSDYKPDVHESVHRDTTMNITNKMHYID